MRLSASAVPSRVAGTAEKTSAHKLVYLLSGDLDFHGQASGYASHNLHSFPAKFPPQLPRHFIRELTCPGDIVLDSMVGSGTTVLEAYLAGRVGLGFDVDPLALKLSKAKVTPLDVHRVADLSAEILARAIRAVTERRAALQRELEVHWDSPTKEFVDCWLAPATQVELLALLRGIERVQDP